MAAFLKINCNRESVEMLLRLILQTCSTDQRHETGRLKHTRTEENVDQPRALGHLALKNYGAETI